MTPVLLFASGYLLRAAWVLRTEDLSEQQASRTLIRGVQLSRQARSACRPRAGRDAGAHGTRAMAGEARPTRRHALRARRAGGNSVPVDLARPDRSPPAHSRREVDGVLRTPPAFAERLRRPAIIVLARSEIILTTSSSVFCPVKYDAASSYTIETSLSSVRAAIFAEPISSSTAFAPVSVRPPSTAISFCFSTAVLLTGKPKSTIQLPLSFCSGICADSPRKLSMNSHAPDLCFDDFSTANSYPTPSVSIIDPPPGNPLYIPS